MIWWQALLLAAGGLLAGAFLAFMGLMIYFSKAFRW